MKNSAPARYRTKNWKSCNGALKRRGSLLVWLDKDMTWLALKAGRPGRPPVFSDAAVQFCLMVKGEGRPENSPGTVFSPERAKPRDGSAFHFGKPQEW